jgi:hypothetical protein
MACCRETDHSLSRFSKALAFVGCVLAVMGVAAAASSARDTVTLIGREIPSRYLPGKAGIFRDSDSLYLNGRLLARNVDYRFDLVTGEFDLSGLRPSADDTLTIAFARLPDWLRRSYGRALPDVSAVRARIPGAAEGVETTVPARDRAEVSISGTKSFRFSTRTAGNADFGQSIDLNISGDLSPGLKISGAVSDRGYDPSYGTANSRLSELDKINLKLESRTLLAQIGNIAIRDRFDNAVGQKRVSGASVIWDNSVWSINAAAARPKGRFETVRFQGVDGTQGPYQIGQGSRARPVVPGSETVWLDGIRLERGANKDYVMDYPAGRITFDVGHPLDARSRVEIDYEPLATDYKEELFIAGGAARLADSAVYAKIEWLREGDDMGQPLTGELSDADKAILSGAGDNPLAAFRSGAAPDTLGSYVLVADSLPDTVFQFMGERLGTYAVTFSYVGPGEGDYRFLGAGRYDYAGRGRGEYLPIVTIPLPQRTDYYNAFLGLRSRSIGTIGAEFRQTRHDRNLLSDRDDNDNDGSLYEFTADKSWKTGDRSDYVRLRSRHKDASFQTRSRIYEADFARTHLLPQELSSGGDETTYDLQSAVSPVGTLTLKPSFSRLEYRDRFVSKTSGLAVEWAPSRRSALSLGWRRISAHLDSSAVTRHGKGDNVGGQMSYTFGSIWHLSTGYEYDRRWNDYTGIAGGVRYYKSSTTVDRQTERVNYEYYVEDTLTVRWARTVARSRLSSSSTRKLGNFNYDLRLSYQWLKKPQTAETSFLGRLGYQYLASARRLNVGGSYAISDENRNARGITYLRVAKGEGNYVYQDSQYVPDPDGDYIKVEELLSDQRRVRRGEKSFCISQDWRHVSLRFNSDISEELLSDGHRTLWWLAPFVSDQSQPYLYYAARYSADVRLLAIRGGHALNLTHDEDVEIRDIAGERRKRRDTRESVVFMQTPGSFSIEERLELFRYRRNSYFGGGDDIDGYRAGTRVRRQGGYGEVFVGGAYRRATAAVSERSEIYAVEVGGRLKVVKRGEARCSLELYRQTLSGIEASLPYLLTDNKSGRRGAVWSIGVNVGFKEGMRLNLSAAGRHSDDRPARITARGEFVVGF